MSDALMPFSGSGLPEPRSNDRDRGPYPAPAWWSQAGARDRRAEDNHVLAIRQQVRQAELTQISEARKLAESVARMEAAARFGTEAKFRLEEADRRSKLIAGDNPVLQQQFAVLDDTLFQLVRSEQVRRSQQP